MDSPLESMEGPNSADTLSSDFWPSAREYTSVVFSYLVCGNMLQQH